MVLLLKVIHLNPDSFVSDKFKEASSATIIRTLRGIKWHNQTAG